mmetsp:Transcript_9038/g.22313  ORF Transcript_9038/g.22313 Transcript_9038/m.22313 type:complete len:203 (-) Transcript_9038:690-1298(-)
MFLLNLPYLRNVTHAFGNVIFPRPSFSSIADRHFKQWSGPQRGHKAAVSYGGPLRSTRAAPCSSTPEGLGCRFGGGLKCRLEFAGILVHSSANSGLSFKKPYSMQFPPHPYVFGSLWNITYPAEFIASKKEFTGQLALCTSIKICRRSGFRNSRKMFLSHPSQSILKMSTVLFSRPIFRRALPTVKSGPLSLVPSPILWKVT